MPEQLRMFSEIIPYIAVVEGLLFCVLQLRTNHLLKRMSKVRVVKKEALEHLKQEVKTGASEIPVVRFENQKKQASESRKAEKEKMKAYDEKELAVLQEMMAEFFG